MFLRSVKNYIVICLSKIAKSQNYERFSCIDVEYTDFLNKLMEVVNQIDQSKKTKIKNNSQEWFDRETAELMKRFTKALH